MKTLLFISERDANNYRNRSIRLGWTCSEVFRVKGGWALTTNRNI